MPTPPADCSLKLTLPAGTGTPGFTHFKTIPGIFNPPASMIMVDI